MKSTLSLLSTLIIGSALTLTACNKDKKPATTTADPAKAEPAAADPAQPDPAAAPAPEDKPMANDKPAGGW